MEDENKFGMVKHWRLSSNICSLLGLQPIAQKYSIKNMKVEGFQNKKCLKCKVGVTF